MREGDLTSDALTVRIERPDRPVELRTISDDNRSSVEELLIGLADENDVILELERNEEKLLIAVDRARVTIGLDSRDAIYQYAAGDLGDGKTTLVVGGQTTDIDRRYRRGNVRGGRCCPRLAIRIPAAVG